MHFEITVIFVATNYRYIKKEVSIYETQGK